MFIAYAIILIVSQLVAIVLRIAGFKHPLLAGMLLFLVAAIGFTLCVHANFINEPFLPAPPYNTKPDTGS